MIPGKIYCKGPVFEVIGAPSIGYLLRVRRWNAAEKDYAYFILDHHDYLSCARSRAVVAHYKPRRKQRRRLWGKVWYEQCAKQWNIAFREACSEGLVVLWMLQSVSSNIRRSPDYNTSPTADRPNNEL